MDLNSTPRLAPGCRLHPTESVLLVPEGTLNLSGPTREILTKLDGTQSVTSIVTDLLREFEGADEVQVKADVLDLLNRLEQRGVIRA
ncbi:MAG TPA: PqqD family peptide modification chaperone [Edaphobacter sp.]|jgi:pyrroloquinoline quinone biosynthesis protein D|nr:PqqD family peptide modification chaperone [Edaphobacter sp.]